MSLGCARCGDCCDPVVLDAANTAKFDQARAEVAEGRPYPPDMSPTASLPFMVEHWTEVERHDDGWATYSCDQFDPVTRSCRAHDNRPDVCRDFPWYSDVVKSGSKFDEGSRCSYLLDVAPADRPEGARPLIPLTVKGAK